MTLSLADEARLSNRLPAPEMARLIIQEAGISVTRLAHEIGVSNTTVHRWLAGTRQPRGRLRVDYARALVAIAEATA